MKRPAAGYFASPDWSSVKKDIRGDLKKRLAAIRKGSPGVKRGTDAWEEKGGLRYRILQLESRTYGRITDLGERVYALMRDRSMNPVSDAVVKDLIAQISKDEAKLVLLVKQAEVVSAAKKTVA